MDLGNMPCESHPILYTILMSIQQDARERLPNEQKRGCYNCDSCQSVITPIPASSALAAWFRVGIEGRLEQGQVADSSGIHRARIRCSTAVRLDALTPWHHICQLSTAIDCKQRRVRLDAGSHLSAQPPPSRFCLPGDNVH